MKKIVCGLLIFALLAGGALGCAKATVPARGVWDDRTYINTDSGIKFTVPEEYNIAVDEEIIEWGEYAEDYFSDIQSTGNYTDVRIIGENSNMIINYADSSNVTGEQYMNLIKAKFKTQTYNGEELNIIYGDTAEKILCGQTYTSISYTLEGVDDYYVESYVRYIKDMRIFINIEGSSQEQVNAYLAFFDTAVVE